MFDPTIGLAPPPMALPVFFVSDPDARRMWPYYVPLLATPALVTLFPWR